MCPLFEAHGSFATIATWVRSFGTWDFPNLSTHVRWTRSEFSCFVTAVMADEKGNYNGLKPTSPISHAFRGASFGLVATMRIWISRVKSPQVLPHLLLVVSVYPLLHPCAIEFTGSNPHKSNLTSLSSNNLARQKMATQDDTAFSLLQRKLAVAKLCIGCFAHLCTVLETNQDDILIFYLALISKKREILRWCPMELLPRVFAAALSNMDARKNQTETRHSIGPINPTYCSDQD